MAYKKQNNHRQSLRLKNYNYSNYGAYYITICVKGKQCLLGNINNGIMGLNQLGNIVAHWWQALPKRFKEIKLDFFVIMPNHIHGILWIDKHTKFTDSSGTIHESSSGAIHELPLRTKRRRMILPKVIGFFKMNASKKINITLENSGKRFWQRNYYEHIIRNNEDLSGIRQYIINNPLKWKKDKYFNPVGAIHKQPSVGAIHKQPSVGAIHKQPSVGAIHESPQNRKIYVFGNPDQPEDSLAVKVAKKLQVQFENHNFIFIKPNQDLPFIDEPEVIIMDTIQGIEKVTILTEKDLDKITLPPRTTAHDFDLGFQLKYLKKLGKLQKIIIIGLPMGGEEKELIKEFCNFCSGNSRIAIE